jgi:DNA-binding protein VF530
MNSYKDETRAITRGPKYHWFGYYDKLQFDPTGRYVLGMEVDFQHRSPRPEDLIKVGMVDLAEDDQWIELGETRAWCWQQGCMLQWRPGSDSEVLWNDREDDRFVCRIFDIFTRETRTVPHAVYSVSPDGRYAIAPDFRRINNTRPGYGYAGPEDPFRDESVPDKSGIHKVDLDTGEISFLFSIQDAVSIPGSTAPLPDERNYFNHLLFHPDGSRFVFLHRRTSPDPKSGFGTRAITAASDGSDFHVVNDSGLWSHFIWRDKSHLLAWSRNASHGDAMYIHEDRTGHVKLLGGGEITSDSHVSYLPGNKWIVGDAYPTADRKQPLFLYGTETGETKNIDSYYLPDEYAGEWRCDLHPRFSRDGTHLSIDSAHDASGRQMYLIEIAAEGEEPDGALMSPGQQANNPLHGVTLEQVVTRLVGCYGWNKLGARIKLKCFTHEPSVKSSLKFLRKNAWARAKVESLYIDAWRNGKI